MQAATQEGVHARLRSAEQQLHHLSVENRKLSAVREELSMQLQEATIMAERVRACVCVCVCVCVFPPLHLLSIIVCLHSYVK